MRHMLVKFKVQEGKAEEVIGLIKSFIVKIKYKEPGVLMYKSYSIKNNNGEFFHIMSFKDEPSEDYHRHTDWVKEFVQKLRPLCTLEPEFIPVDFIESI